MIDPFWLGVLATLAAEGLFFAAAFLFGVALLLVALWFR